MHLLVAVDLDTAAVLCDRIAWNGVLALIPTEVPGVREAVRIGVEHVVTYDERMAQSATDLGLSVLAPR